MSPHQAPISNADGESDISSDDEIYPLDPSPTEDNSSSSDDEPILAARNLEGSHSQPLRRSMRDHRPPDRYGDQADEEELIELTGDYTILLIAILLA